MIPKARFFVTAAIAEIGCLGISFLLCVALCRPPGPVRLQTHNGGICHGPLSSSPDAIVERPFVCVIPAISVCKEERIDSSPLQQLREVDPVLQVPLRSRLVFWVLWRVSTCPLLHAWNPPVNMPHTFHCPGDKCPIVDISKALSSMCLVPSPDLLPCGTSLLSLFSAMLESAFDVAVRVVTENAFLAPGKGGPQII